jgi:hypothetical protein
MVSATLGCTVARSSEEAPGRTFGLGVEFGEPTGISGKYWTGSKDAVDMGLAYSLRNYMLVFVDKLWHFPGAFGSRDEFARRLSPYIGVGAGFLFGNDFRLDARIPLGIEWLPRTARLGVFLELVPALRLAPNMTGDVGGGIGVRYYF